MVTEIRNATEGDLEKIKADLLYEWEKSYPIDHLAGWSKSLYIYDELIAVGGVMQFWTGVGEAWLVLGSKAAEHKIEVVRQVRRMIELAFIELRLHRIQATERCDFPQTNKMAIHLGFKLEGIMLKYTADGGNAGMYSIVKDEV